MLKVEYIDPPLTPPPPLQGDRRAGYVNMCNMCAKKYNPYYVKSQTYRQHVCNTRMEELCGRDASTDEERVP